MKVSEALDSRRAIRAFLPKQLPTGLLRTIIDQAKRAPSGGNMQPWHVYACEGEGTKRLLAAVAEDLAARPGGDPPEYMYYPRGTEPFTSRRIKCAEDMYALLSIPREDKPRRLEHLARNYVLFDAPVGLFFTIDRSLDRNHWGQLGMFVQSVMLLAREYGLHTCPQEAWNSQRTTLGKFFGIPDNEIVVVGVSMGYADPDAPVNKLRTDRAPLDEIATFITE